MQTVFIRQPSTFQSRKALSSVPSCYPWTLLKSGVIPFLIWLPKDALSMSVSFQHSLSVPRPRLFEHSLCCGQYNMRNFCTKKVVCGRYGQFLLFVACLFLPLFCSIVTKLFLLIFTVTKCAMYFFFNS